MREMNAEEFRNDAMEKKDKSSGMLTADEVLMSKGFKYLTREEANEYVDRMMLLGMRLYQMYIGRVKKDSGKNNQDDQKLSA